MTSISSNFSDAAGAILTHSFAIVRLDDATAQLMSKSWHSARNFFATVASSPARSLSKYRRIIGGHLVGLNYPTEAKVLYRTICTEWGQQYQPWPDDIKDAAELKSLSMDLAERLHRILFECLQEIRVHLADENARQQPERKRRRVSYETQQPNRRYPPPPGTFRERQYTKKSIHVPETLQEGYICPLDYFLYHGEKSSTNCSEHIDRGVLICVSLTDVPGLECQLRPKEGGNKSESPVFVCPETLSANESLFQDRQPCSGLICIMAGDQLKAVCPSMSLNYNNDKCLDACVHRVRQDLKRARLSITYELRGRIEP